MRKRGLPILLALYLALAAGFAAVTPFGKAPDETAHAVYVEHLVREKRLPVLRQERREAYEYHQPPLYYVLAAPVWAAAAPVSPNAARMAARGVSILAGLVGVWLIAALARAAWPEKDALALGAAGFAALLPMRLATAASVSNDTLIEAVFSAALLLMVLALRRGAGLRSSAALGAVLGLGILTKSSSVLLFPVALVALLLACRFPMVHSPDNPQSAIRKPQSPGRFDSGLFLQCAAITFGLALLIGGPWMVRNAILYGDPLGTKSFEQYFQDTPTPAMLEQALGYSRMELLTRKVLPLTFTSFWGVFGHMNLFMGAYPKDVDAPGWTYLLADRGYPPASWLYPLLLLVTLVSVAGLLKKFTQVARPDPRGPGARTRERRSQRAKDPTPSPLHRSPSLEWVPLTFIAFLVLAAFLRFNTVFFQAQGRYLFPAMGPIALGFAAGWLSWWPAHRSLAGAFALLGSMLLLSLYALFGTVMPAY